MIFEKCEIVFTENEFFSEKNNLRHDLKESAELLAEIHEIAALESMVKSQPKLDINKFVNLSFEDFLLKQQGNVVVISNQNQNPIEVKQDLTKHTIRIE